MADNTKPTANKGQTQGSSSSANKATSSSTSSSTTGQNLVPWNGVLSPADLAKLRQDYGEVILCPALAKDLEAADTSGKMIIPGAKAGYTAVKAVLAGWQKEGSENERYRWWPGALAEDGAEPLRVKSLLEGLPKQDWRVYRKRYLRLHQHRRVAQNEQRKREVARAKYGDQVVEGAESLVKMSIGSSSSSSPARPPPRD